MAVEAHPYPPDAAGTKASSASPREPGEPIPSLTEAFGESGRRPFIADLVGSTHRRLKRIALTAAALAAIAALYYRYALAPTAVASYKVTAGRLVREVMGTGTLEARIKANVSAKIAGRITAVLVDQGDEVSAGQVLVRLDDEDLARQVQVEQANVAASQAALGRLQADLAYAEANLDVASKNYERMTRMLPTQAVSQEDFDQSAGTFTMAQAALERSNAALLEGQKQLIAAEQTLEFHKARLEDTVIVAPFAGLVVRRDRDPGDVIVPGTSVLLLISLKEIWVQAWVDETEMARLKPQQPAKVVFRSEPEHPYDGRLVRLGRESDRETREFLIDVLPSELPASWSVGQRAEVYVEISRKNDVLLLPTEYLLRKAGEQGTYLAIDGKATWRPLELGLRGRQAVQVTAGLQAGDLVVRPLGPKAVPLADGRRVSAR
jgi:HlyD family secretion protein